MKRCTYISFKFVCLLNVLKNICGKCLLRMNTGLSKAAKEEHARDLPLMNGIKEVIKSVGVLDSGSPGYREALSNLSTRLKSLQVNHWQI